MPVAISDIQEGHVFVSRSARIVDLELWRAGTPGEIDLLSLLNLCHKDRAMSVPWDAVIESYKAGRGRSYNGLPIPVLLKGLSLAAKAFGISHLL